MTLAAQGKAGDPGRTGEARGQDDEGSCDPDDPFRHHPGLRGRIADPDTSFWRRFSPRDLDATVTGWGGPGNWRFGDDQIAGMQDAFLADHGADDLWVFAYGSLMWDPGFRFAEVRRGRARGYARRFCLLDKLGGRGTPEAPGLMVALDREAESQAVCAAVCDGLVFRLRAADLATEITYLWQREMLAPAYLPVKVPVQTAQGQVRALAFAADPAAATIRTDLTRPEQVRLLATGKGMLGTSLHYIEALVAQLEALDIADPDLAGLLAEARAFAATVAATGP